MARVLDLGPAAPDPVGVITRSASPDRMAVKHAPQSAPGVVEIDQPFRVMVVQTEVRSTARGNRTRWAVQIERDGYELKVKQFKGVTDAMAMAVFLCAAFASRNFYVTGIDISEIDSENGDRDEFYTVTGGRAGLICRITDEVLADAGNDAERVTRAFRDLMN